MAIEDIITKGNLKKITSTFSRYCQGLGQKIDVRIFAVVISCLLSLYAIHYDSLLNSDAFTYLKTAELSHSEGFVAALERYSWPAYSIIIAIIHSSLHISFLNAAYLLNIILYGVLVYGFISLLAEINPSKNISFFAALTILALPQLNEYRHYIIRDAGYWAFGIVALHQLICYHRNNSWCHALAWFTATLLAALVRAEILILILIAPLSVLFNAQISNRLCSYGKLQIFPLGLLSLLYFSLMQINIDIVSIIENTFRFYLPTLFNLADSLANTSDQLSQAIFNARAYSSSEKYSLLILSIGFVVILLVEIIGTIGLPYGLLLLYGLSKKYYKPKNQAFWPIIMYLLTGFIFLLLFVFIMHFMVGRYTLFVVIILSVFVPFVLDNMYLNATIKNSLKRFRFLLGLLVVYCFFDGLVSFGHSKQYVHEAINWIKFNTEESDPLYTNSPNIAYLTRRSDNYGGHHKPSLLAYVNKLTANVPKTKAIVALKITHDEVEFINDHMAANKFNLLQTFANKKGSQVKIYSAFALK